MSNAVFPVLPGLSWGRTLTPVWKTDVKESVSGMEFRWSAMAYPRYRVALKYEVLRAGAGVEELQALVGFFNARRGAWDDFLWLDEADRLAADELLGLGDGANKVYPIFRRRGGFAEPVLNFVAPPVVRVNGVDKALGTDYTLSGGIVTFIKAPFVGAAVTWSGEFYKRVRFERNEVEFEEFLRDLWAARRVDLITVKG